mgnify:CR=1 FL=1
MRARPSKSSGGKIGSEFRAANTTSLGQVGPNLASLSTGGATDILNKRKFQFPPDLVFSTDSIGNYTAVLLGSGDREHPFDTTVVNRFYMLKDRDSADIGDPQSGATNATSVKISGWGGSDPTGDPIADTDVFDATSTVLIDATDPLGQGDLRGVD